MKDENIIAIKSRNILKHFGSEVRNGGQDLKKNILQQQSLKKADN